MDEEAEDRPAGGVDITTFVPPHLGRIHHPRSIFKVNQICPVHGDTSESLEESWLSKLTNRSPTSQIPPTGSSAYQNCVCFKIPKRVRFAAYPSTSSTTNSSIFAASKTPTKF
ncbi:unnamed protein product [Caenorhabditis angaria]|uniref:Uncharacterized protein n=1 Tax=Caenorhabditis angaria TaxID=860376 RepID=A0A9P1I9V5_9PELO|nr:unnamed protein product [Caenorhabditis angaria]